MNSSKYPVMICQRYFPYYFFNHPTAIFKQVNRTIRFPSNVFFFADLSIPVIESTVCPPHYVENNGRCYRFFQDIPLDWESADHFCTLDNGTLASISTLYRFGFIQALGRHVNLTTYWIGLRRSNV